MKRPALDVLEDLARDDAQARADDGLWIRRAAGRASPEEEALLAARARTNEEDALLLETTAPLSSAQMDALVTSLRGTAMKTQAPKPSRLRVVATWGTPLLAAASLLLFLRPRSTTALVPLPAYTLSIDGADAESRGTEPTPAPVARHKVSPGARLTIVLRPEETVSNPVAAVGFIEHAAAVRSLPVLPRVSPSGTVRVEGTREELFGTDTGAVDVVLFVGAMEKLPRAPSEKDLPPSVHRAEVLLDLP